MSSATGSRPAPSGRFPSASRVRKRAEFLSIQERGQRVSTPRFVFILSASADPGSPRIGITASRKVGNAVVRSRTKRLIREAFRATRELWPVGIDVVVIAKRSPGEAKLESVVLEWLAARAQIERRVKALLGGAGQADPAAAHSRS